MILKKQCKCGQQIEFEAEDLAQLSCPNCGESLHDQFSVDPRAPKQPPREFSISPVREAPKISALKDVRRQTSYPALRGLINIAFWIGFAFLLLTGVAVIMTTPMAFKDSGLIAPIVIIAALAFAAVVLVASREALFVGMDIADVLIADRSDRLEAERYAATRRDERAVGI